jgi:ABC-type transporter Mla MlaB component
MLKISKGKKTKQTMMLRIEGRLVGPWVAELEQNCEPLLRDARKLKLELTEMVFVDEAGAALLMSLKHQGATLLNASPFVEEQLKTLEIS